MKKVIISLAAILSISVLLYFNPFRAPQSITFSVNSSVLAPVGETQIVANVSIYAQSVEGLLSQGDSQTSVLLNELRGLTSVTAIDTAASVTDQVGTAQYSKTISVRVTDPAQIPSVTTILERNGASILQTSYLLANSDQAHAELSQQASQKARDRAAIVANSFGRRRGKLLQLVENQAQASEQTLYTQFDQNNQLVTELRKSYTVSYSIW